MNSELGVTHTNESSLRWAVRNHICEFLLLLRRTKASPKLGKHYIAFLR